MAKHTNSTVVPKPLEWKRSAQNGELPLAGYLAKVTADYQHCVGKQTRCGLVVPGLDNLVGGGAAETGVMRQILRTGMGQTTAVGYVGMADMSSAQDGYITIVAERTSDLAATSSSQINSRFDGGSGTSTAPDDLFHARVEITGLLEDTEYSFRIDANYSLLIYWLQIIGQQRKVDDSSAGVASPSNFVVDGPIYADDLLSLSTAGSQIWRKNGRSLFTFSHWNSAKTSTSATYVNALDTSVTTGSSTSPGFQVDLANQARRSVTTIPVRFAVYATAAGVPNGVKFVDQANNTLAEMTAFGDGTYPLEALRSVETSIASSVTKVDMLIKGDGSNAFSLYSASMYSYLADPFAYAGDDMWTLVERYTVSSGPVAGYTFSSLDGNTDKEYVLQYSVLQTAAASLSMELRPNATAPSGTGASATHRSSYQLWTDAGATATSNPDTIPLLAGGSAGGTWRCTGRIHIFADTSGVRRFHMFGSRSDSTNGAMTTLVGAAVWKETSTNITSLQVLSGGTDILDNSFIELYSRA